MFTKQRFDRILQKKPSNFWNVFIYCSNNGSVVIATYRRLHQTEWCKVPKSINHPLHLLYTTS